MKKILMAALLAAGSWTALSAQTQVIAHRGYWDCDGSAQNSIAALVKAAEAGAYGSEFDVSITADGVPVVNHDDDIRGHVIETSVYASIKDLKLPNGETLLHQVERQRSLLERALAAYGAGDTQIEVAAPRPVRTEAELIAEYSQRPELQECLSIFDGRIDHCRPL